MIIQPVTISGSIHPQSRPASYSSNYNGTDFEFVTLQDMFDPSERTLAAQPSLYKNIVSTPVLVSREMFGMHFSKLSRSSNRVLVPNNMNSVGWARSHDSEVRWSQINTANGVYDWSPLDRWLEGLESRNIKPVYVVFGTPGWASARPGESSAYGINGLAAEPSSMASLSAFLTELVNRYGQRIKHFEVWNEVNQTGFFSGTKDALANIVQTVVNVVKGYDETNVVISPSVVGLKATSVAPAETYLSQMLNTVSSEGGNSIKSLCDVISFHSYCENSRYADVPYFHDRVKAVVSAAGINKPIWDTEVGITVTPELRTDYHYALTMVRSQLYSIFSGSPCFWYGYDYGNGTGFTMGFHQRPFVLSMRENLIAQLIGATVTNCIMLSGGELYITSDKGPFVI